ncbi:hypothetical protein HAX54_016020, partial [Datura stramonium]|nr:hypothetical protein [Datura stramonium]
MHHVDRNEQRPSCTCPRGQHSWQSSLLSPEGMASSDQASFPPIWKQILHLHIFVSLSSVSSAEASEKMDQQNRKFICKEQLEMSIKLCYSALPISFFAKAVLFGFLALLVSLRRKEKSSYFDYLC